MNLLKFSRTYLVVFTIFMEKFRTYLNSLELVFYFSIISNMGVRRKALLRKGCRV